MEEVRALPWGRIALVAGALLAINLAVRAVSALVSMAKHEAHHRLHSGQLSKRR